jgi:hypothetical protein
MAGNVTIVRRIRHEMVGESFVAGTLLDHLLFYIMRVSSPTFSRILFELRLDSQLQQHQLLSITFSTYYAGKALLCFWLHQLGYYWEKELCKT